MNRGAGAEPKRDITQSKSQQRLSTSNEESEQKPKIQELDAKSSRADSLEASVIL